MDSKIILNTIEKVVYRLMNLGGADYGKDKEATSSNVSKGLIARDFGIEEWDWPQGVGLYGLTKLQAHLGDDRYDDFLISWFERNIEVDGLSCRLISDSNGKYGLVSNDNSNRIVLNVEYEKIRDRTYGGTNYDRYIYICKDGLWGICKSADGQNLKIILDCKYPGYANADSDNNPPFEYARGYERFVVTAEGMAGVIDENGKEVLSLYLRFGVV